MSYQETTIKGVIKQINGGKVYLPALQRKFVWDMDQIEMFFDSIMRNYPIGTFLFWLLKKPNINDYVFYKFLDVYDIRDGRNRKAPHPLTNETIIGVLDGQQRLSSLYLALQGSYIDKLKYYRWENDYAFQPKKLYLNILQESVKDAEDEEENYNFKFLTNHEAKKANSTNYWLDVRTVFDWSEDPPIDEYYDKIFSQLRNDELKNAFIKNRTHIKSTIRILHKRIVSDPLINYYKIEKDSLDEILKIFVRVNSGGTILSKTDLLFSTIVANWEEGRDEIEELIKQINKKGDGFSFNNDFIMRSCLVLTDSPIVFKVKSFKTENVLKIKDQWPEIQDAIRETVDLLVEFGFNRYNLTSQNAVIPIAYYIIKKGKLDRKIKNNIQHYLIHSLLKGIFGGQSDTVLSSLRNALRKEVQAGNQKRFELKNDEYNFSDILRIKLPANKSLYITSEDIEEFLTYKKGSNTFSILSLLYPQLKFNQVQFHQDHIHPESKFSNSELKTIGLDDEQIKIWQNMKDQLPNLQLMEGKENESKYKKHFEVWFNGVDDKGMPNVSDKTHFLRQNYIPENTSLEFKNFIDFFIARKESLMGKIKELFIKIDSYKN